MPTQQDARAALQKLLERYHAINPTDRLALTESDILEKFVVPLFHEVLGWHVHDANVFTNEVTVRRGKRVDRKLTAANGERVYIEAKRFGVIKTLVELEAQSTYGGLLRESQKRSGMERAFGPEMIENSALAPNRTIEEQQAINYAFEDNGTWAILTNFERFRLFNARRDWLVFTVEEPGGYLDEWDYLWMLSYDNISKGSLDRLLNVRFGADIDREYLKLIDDWRVRLANDLLNHAQRNSWMRGDDGKLQLTLIRAVVQRFIDRLVMIRFAEDHLVTDPGIIYSYYQMHQNSRFMPEMDLLLDSFFRKFDAEYNSALFAADLTDTAFFSNAVLLPLVENLYRVKYRAMPADILGNTYEQYLGKTLVLDGDRIDTRDNLETRKKQGSYYTPQVIVRYIVDNSLGRYLYGTANGKADGEPVAGETRKTSRDIRDLRVLDSACGSGSFLIYAYQVLAAFYEAEITRLKQEVREKADELAAQGHSDIDVYTLTASYRAELTRIEHHYPTLILETHIYGVDLDPQAAEIAVVNLMMRAMERQGSDKRLPLILNQNVKVGNSLIGLRPDDARLDEHSTALARLRQLRLDLKATSHRDPAHQQIMDDLEAATKALYALFAPDFSRHFTDMERVKPFHWALEFPECFFDSEGKRLEKSGFQVIIGNPPWEIVKPDLREYYAQFDENIESRLSRAQAETRIAQLDKEDPTRRERYNLQRRDIEEQRTYYQTNADYTRQGERSDTATHKLFMERAYAHLLAHGGRLGYVVPSGLYTDLGTKVLREMLLNEGRIEYLYGIANIRNFFPEVDIRFKFTLLGVQKGILADSFDALFFISGAEWSRIPEMDAQQALLQVISNPQYHIKMSTNAIAKFSPDSLSVTEFKSRQDYQVTEKIYSNHAFLGEELDTTWNLRLQREFDMTDDRDIFNSEPTGLPLYEGKMIWHFDAYYDTPRYWIDESTGKSNLPSVGTRQTDYQSYRLTIRRIASNTNERTLVSAILPRKVFSGNSLFNEVGSELSHDVRFYIMSVLNSFVLDYCLRQKMTANVNLFYLKQLPLPRLVAGNPYFDALVIRAARLTCVREEFDALWREVMTPHPPAPSPTRGEGESSAMPPPPNPLPQSVGEGEQSGSNGVLQPVTDAEGRQVLRDEIDALVAHLYGLSRDEFNHILGTFPLVFPATEAGQAKRARLLAVYDEWAAKVTGWARG